jgi:hypothetical protein
MILLLKSPANFRAKLFLIRMLWKFIPTFCRNYIFTPPSEHFSEMPENDHLNMRMKLSVYEP